MSDERSPWLIAKEVEQILKCSCNPKKWHVTDETGHDRFCRIHLETIERWKKQMYNPT